MRSAATATNPTMIPLDRPWVIGHRGFSSKAVENTIPSFEAALAAGARGLECDVRGTRDGHVVVFHDDSTRRLMGVNGRIEDLTSDQVRALRFADGPADLRIPDLEDVLWLASERDAIVLVELKGSPIVFSDFSRAVVAAVERTQSRARVGFMSFCHSAIAELRELEPAIPVAPLFDRTPAIEAILFHGVSWAVFAANAITEDLAAGLKAVGVTTGSYGVDDAATDARLDALGVGLRITDRPDLLAARRAQ
jgi:glycerophosphoryl diester phosphodiesterase